MSSTKTEELPKPPPATLDLSTYRLWWEPEPLEPSVDALTTLNDDHSSSSSQAARPLLSDYQVERWLSDGFLALDNIWPAELIARAAREAYAYFPLPDQREVCGEARRAGQAVALLCQHRPIVCPPGFHAVFRFG
jgi:hypothetical protein